MNFTDPFHYIWIPNTPHVIFIRSHGLYRGPKNQKRNIWYLKIISAKVCLKIFFIIGKKLNYFGTGCPKSALRGGEKNVADFVFS